jgi:hypothetical protein
MSNSVSMPTLILLAGSLLAWAGLQGI